MARGNRPGGHHVGSDMAVVWVMSLPGLVVLLVAVAALERFGLWVSRTSWLPWRSRRTTVPVSAMAFDELGATFYAGKRVEMEQRRSESTLREDDAQGAPPRTGVDLDSGRVVLRRPAP